MYFGHVNDKRNVRIHRSDGYVRCDRVESGSYPGSLGTYHSECQAPAAFVVSWDSVWTASGKNSSCVCKRHALEDIRGIRTWQRTRWIALDRDNYPIAAPKLIEAPTREAAMEQARAIVARTYPEIPARQVYVVVPASKWYLTWRSPFEAGEQGWRCYPIDA